MFIFLHKLFLFLLNFLFLFILLNLFLKILNKYTFIFSILIFLI